jgi:hypothetical protein
VAQDVMRFLDHVAKKPVTGRAGGRNKTKRILPPMLDVRMVEGAALQRAVVDRDD